MWKVGVKIPLYFEVKSILVLSTSPRRPKRARVSLSLAHKSFYQTHTNILSNANKSFLQTDTKLFSNWNNFFLQTDTNLLIKLKQFFIFKLMQFFLSNAPKSFFIKLTHIFKPCKICIYEGPLNAWKVTPTYSQGAQGHFGSHLTHLKWPIAV